MRNPVGWFGIHAQDMARAKTFYENVFGLPLQEIAGGRFYLFGTDWQHYGVSGMIWQDEGANPAAYGGSTLFFTCEDCTAAAETAVAHGGKLLQEKFPIANGFAAFIEDSEGNRIGLYSQK